MGQTTTAEGVLTMSGASGNLQKIRSTMDGSEAFLVLAETGTGSFVDVKDNHAIHELAVLDATSVISSNATGWAFSNFLPGLSPAWSCSLASSN